VTANTDVYGFPYPEETDKVIDGDNAMQALAEAVESALLAPYLAVAATTANTDADFRIQWDAANPAQSRGDWTWPAGSRLVQPPEPGVYLVAAQHNTHTGDTGWSVQIQTKVQGANQNTAVTWMVQNANTNPSIISAAGLVVIDGTAGLGIQIVTGGSNSGGVGAQLQIVQLSRFAS
jgi:hypothetical protein